MGIPVAVIADELTADLWRIGGASVETPERGEAASVFEKMRGTAELLIITAEYAEQLPRRRLAEALHAREPLVLVVADVLGRQQPPDLERYARRVLGIEL
jgi:vacuolar-type H+-ATPase subunit F/Vma7